MFEEVENHQNGITKHEYDGDTYLKQIKQAIKMVENQLTHLEENKPLISYENPIFIPESNFEKYKTKRELEDQLLLEEAKILQDIQDLQRRGLWSKSNLPNKRFLEPPRIRSHWDFVLAEMQWYQEDMMKEQKAKILNAKKVSQKIQHQHYTIISRENKKKKEEEIQIRKVASKMSKMIQKEFWSKVSKIVEMKHQSRIQETIDKSLARKREHLVKHTENISKMLSKELENPSTTPMSPTSSVALSSPRSTSQIQEDFDEEDFEKEEEDDESTLIEEEKMANGDDRADEISKLQDESELSLEELLAQYGLKKGTTTTLQGDNDEDDEMEEEEEDIDETEEEEEEEDVMTVEPSTETKTDDTSKNLSSKERITEAATFAESAQPQGYTLSTTKILTAVPTLLNPKYTLREYQLIGLDWLVKMYDKGLNGILADEMGLGKTVMTIAFLAYLASERGSWGPHLVIVPASVIINWEIEFKRWAPGMKIICYYGSQKQRKAKRSGWSKPNSFHICITSYNIALQDEQIFRRKAWNYMILDEAQHIKNFKSRKWQVLLNFNSKGRLLLTGTPLQNSVMELWSLMHFLMPHLFESNSEFKEWFSKPVTGMIEGKQEIDEEQIARLHTILRPFLLRRLKKDVEKQLPQKYEHIIKCKLSKRQRLLYEDFMSRAETRDNLESGSLFKVLGVIMQLRKVCNHPDLFESRPIISPFLTKPLTIEFPKIVVKVLEREPFESVNLDLLGFNFIKNETQSAYDIQLIQELAYSDSEFRHILKSKPIDPIKPAKIKFANMNQYVNNLNKFEEKEKNQRIERLLKNNKLKCEHNYLVFGQDLVKSLTIEMKNDILTKPDIKIWSKPSKGNDIILTPEKRFDGSKEIIENFTVFIPKVQTIQKITKCVSNLREKVIEEEEIEKKEKLLSSATDVYRSSFIRSKMYFPDKRLIQVDCGKFYVLSNLLRKLKQGSHRVLIFTQMSKMLDILEEFLCMLNVSYLRLDGSTKIEMRQYLMDKFNNDPNIFSGGFTTDLFKKVDMKEIFDESIKFEKQIFSNVSDKEMQNALTTVEDKSDVQAMKLLQQEINENEREIDDLENEDSDDISKLLSPIELFALKFLELQKKDDIIEEINRIEEEKKQDEQTFITSLEEKNPLLSSVVKNKKNEIDGGNDDDDVEFYYEVENKKEFLKSLSVIIDDDFKEFYPEYLTKKKKIEKKKKIVIEEKESKLSSSLTSTTTTSTTTSSSSDEKKKKSKKEKETTSRKREKSKKKVISTGEISWKSVEDSTILDTYEKYGKNWNLISEKVNHSMIPTTSPRNPKNCENRFDTIKNNPRKDFQQEILNQKQKNLNQVSKIWDVKKPSLQEIKPKNITSEKFDKNKITVATPIDYLVTLVNQKFDDKLPPRFLSNKNFEPQSNLMSYSSQNQIPIMMNHPMPSMNSNSSISPNLSPNIPPNLQPSNLQSNLQPNMQVNPNLQMNSSKNNSQMNSSVQINPNIQKTSNVQKSPNVNVQKTSSSNIQKSTTSVQINPNLGAQRIIKNQPKIVSNVDRFNTGGTTTGGNDQPNYTLPIGKKLEPVPISKSFPNVVPQTQQKPVTQPSFLPYFQPAASSNKLKRDPDSVNNTQKKRRMKKE
eukprot:gene9323-1410_t